MRCSVVTIRSVLAQSGFFFYLNFLPCHLILTKHLYRPQLYVNGEFIGGTDIVSQMHESGELKELLAEAKASDDGD